LGCNGGEPGVEPGVVITERPKETAPAWSSIDNLAKSHLTFHQLVFEGRVILPANRRVARDARRIQSIAVEDNSLRTQLRRHSDKRSVSGTLGAGPVVAVAAHEDNAVADVELGNGLFKFNWPLAMLSARRGDQLSSQMSFHCFASAKDPPHNNTVLLGHPCGPVVLKLVRELFISHP
jgi:hypothetical protein